MGLISLRLDKMLGGGGRLYIQEYFSALENNVCVCVGGGGYAEIFYGREKMVWG